MLLCLRRRVHTALYSYSFYITRSFFFFFNDTATTEIYTLSLHDALPICHASRAGRSRGRWPWPPEQGSGERGGRAGYAAALRGAALALGGPAHQIQQLSRIELDVGLEDLRSPGVAAGTLAGEVAVLLVVEIGEAVLLQVVLDVQHLAAQQQGRFGRAPPVSVHRHGAAIEARDRHQRDGEDGERDHHLQQRESALHRRCPGASSRWPTTFTLPVSGETRSEYTSPPCDTWMEASSVSPLAQT